MKVLYNIGISSYSLAIKIAGIFGNKKAKKWSTGRKNWRSTVHSALEKNTSKVIWIHATSLGEFDQVKPLIEKIRNDGQYANFKIVSTFFSPSGYEYSKNYPLTDHIFYLPSDTKKNAQDFIALINPAIAIFVKYDFWFNYLSTLQGKQIPILYFSSNFRINQIYFRKSNQWQLDILKKVNCILTLNAQSKSILDKFGFKNAAICGDTRFDKVILNAKRCEPILLIEKFKQSFPLLILGSSWEKEEDLLAHLLLKLPDWDKRIKIIVAPHNIYHPHIDEIENKLPVNTLRFSEANDNNIQSCNVLIIDNIGMLSNLYQYGDIALIGGGFNNKLHNILEAATFSNVVLYGNNNSKFPEGKLLADFGGGIELADESHFVNEIDSLLNNNDLLETRKTKAKQFIQENTGATEIVFTEMSKLLYSTTSASSNI